VLTSHAKRDHPTLRLIKIVEGMMMKEKSVYQLKQVDVHIIVRMNFIMAQIKIINVWRKLAMSDLLMN
jgi:hypothetical protein